MDKSILKDKEIIETTGEIVEETNTESIGIPDIEKNNQPQNNQISIAEDGSYRTFLYISFPLPNQQAFHVNLLLPLMARCKDMPIMLGDKKYGTLTDKIIASLDDNCFGIETIVESDMIDIDLTQYHICLDIDIDENITDPNSHYKLKDIKFMVKVNKATLELDEESETIESE